MALPVGFRSGQASRLRAAGPGVRSLLSLQGWQQPGFFNPERTSLFDLLSIKPVTEFKS